jgi:hypothetical protein
MDEEDFETVKVKKMKKMKKNKKDKKEKKLKKMKVMVDDEESCHAITDKVKKLSNSCFVIYGLS